MFIDLPMAGHLGYLQFFEIINKAAEKIQAWGMGVFSKRSSLHTQSHNSHGGRQNRCYHHPLTEERNYIKSK